MRTGWWTKFPECSSGDEWYAKSPGLSWRCAEWLSDNAIAAVAADNMAVEAMPPAEDGVYLLLNMLTPRDMGTMLGEIWDLEAHAAGCAADG